jgi:hypothetical protein
LPIAYLRYYKLVEELAIDSDRQAVWKTLNQRWEAQKNKIAETTAQQCVDRGQIKSKILYKNNPSVPENKPEKTPKNYVAKCTTYTRLTIK